MYTKIAIFIFKFLLVALLQAKKELSPSARTKNLFDSVFFSRPSIVHRLNKNIFDQKLQWFKDYLFCRFNPNPEGKEDLRDNISKVAA